MNRVMIRDTVGGRPVVFTRTRWEPVIGYSRAVRAGKLIAVAGTIGLAPDGTCPPSLGDQMRNALEIIFAAVEALGGSRKDIFRTRIYVTDISRWEEVGRVHGEMPGDVKPATTMVEVGALAAPAALVEVEADAMVAQLPGGGLKPAATICKHDASGIRKRSFVHPGPGLSR